MTDQTTQQYASSAAVMPPDSPASVHSEYSTCSFDDSSDFGQPPYMSSDELPIFRIQSLSPSGRSLSPIDNVSLLDLSISPLESSGDESMDEDYHTDEERVSLLDITAQIGMSPPNKRLNLETIFEGQFLETPPKKHIACRIAACRKLTVDSINRFVLDQQNRDYCAEVDAAAASTVVPHTPLMVAQAATDDTAIDDAEMPLADRFHQQLSIGQWLIPTTNLKILMTVSL